MFVLLGTTKGDADIPRQTKVIAACERRQPVEDHMAACSTLRDDTLRKHPTEAYCIYSEYKIVEVPTIA